MKILVTGGLGHIGSYLMRNLHRDLKVEQITVLDSLQTQRYSSLFDLPQSPRIVFQERDIRTLSVKDLTGFGAYDCAVHLAATTDASGTVDKRDDLLMNNLGTTQHMLEVCGEAGVPLIFPSSTSVYGSQDALVDETCADLKPQSPYAESKLLEEKAIIDGSFNGLKGVVLRFGTIHGISQGMRFHTAVNKFCYQTSLGIPITVWRTALHQKRPYLALQDASSAIAHVITNGLYGGEIYNVVTSNHTVNEIIETIKRHTDNQCIIEFVDNRIMNQLSYEVSSKKLKGTGFEFQGELDSDIADTMKLLSGISNG